VKPLYELIGRLVIAFVRVRFRSQIRVAGALAVLSALGIAYLAAGRDGEAAG